MRYEYNSYRTRLPALFDRRQPAGIRHSGSQALCRQSVGNPPDVDIATNPYMSMLSVDVSTISWYSYCTTTSTALVPACTRTVVLYDDDYSTSTVLMMGRWEVDEPCP